MEPAIESRASRLGLLLAGLQAGMVGVCSMLAWLGVSSAWQRRSFWTAENLMASAFYGERAIRSGFAAGTVSGLALYLLLYSILGALFALTLAERLSRLRVLLCAVLFGLGWYFVSFRLLWKSAMPLVALLHAERATLLGHLVYGTFLGRYPEYLPKAKVPEPEPVQIQEAPAEAPLVESPSQPPES
jgi:hypothetical protein